MVSVQSHTHSQSYNYNIIVSYNAKGLEIGKGERLEISYQKIIVKHIMICANETTPRKLMSGNGSMERGFTELKKLFEKRASFQYEAKMYLILCVFKSTE